MTVHALHRTSVDTALVAGKIKAWQKYGPIQLLVLLDIINITIFFIITGSVSSLVFLF